MRDAGRPAGDPERLGIPLSGDDERAKANSGGAGQRLLVWTGAATWKARRIRHDPRVLVAACNLRGRERGPRLEGTARILGADAADLVIPLLRRKYSWQRRLLELQSRLSGHLSRRPRPAPAYIEITEARTDAT